jgi:hypothetical protein
LRSTQQRQNDSRNQIHCELAYHLSQFQKRGQDFIRTHDEMLSVAMRVHNPNRSFRRIQKRHPTQAPSGFMEIVSDDFPKTLLGCIVPPLLHSTSQREFSRVTSPFPA